MRGTNAFTVRNNLCRAVFSDLSRANQTRFVSLRIPDLIAVNVDPYIACNAPLGK
jgi:hypothetical protein